MFMLYDMSSNGPLSVLIAVQFTTVSQNAFPLGLMLYYRLNCGNSLHANHFSSILKVHWTSDDDQFCGHIIRLFHISTITVQVRSEMDSAFGRIFLIWSYRYSDKKNAENYVYIMFQKFQKERDIHCVFYWHFFAEIKVEQTCENAWCHVRYLFVY